MTERLFLVKPTLAYKDQLLAYKAETLAIEPQIHGDGGLDTSDTVEDWLYQLSLRENPATCPPGYVPSTTLIAVREADNRLVGFVDIRHALNDWLMNSGGHIGYSIRPDERAKGYGKEQLRLALEYCRKLGINRVLLCCDQNNSVSKRTILSCGAMFEDERPDPDGGISQRFWKELNSPN